MGFNVPMAHKLTAGADILLMPSRFEPCGLNQIYAMAYGTIPVAHATGGLRNTVIECDAEAGTATGFTFENATSDGLKYAAYNAIRMYREEPEEFRKLQLRGMAADFSWDKAAESYEEIFDWSHTDNPYCG